MPALTPAAQLRAMVASRTATDRYIDMTMHLRRLSVAHGVAKQRLTAEDGTEVYVGERSVTGDYPVASIVDVDGGVVGETRHLCDGDTLYADDGAAVTLRTETLLAVGGVWDSLKQEYVLEADGSRRQGKPHVVDLVESQIEYCRAFVSWMADFKARRRRLKSMLGHGGRRSGKSLITLLCLVAFLLEFPRIGGRLPVAWLIVVSHPERVELDNYIRDFLPSSWATFRELPFHSYSLANGVQIMYKTTQHDYESLRVGTCDIAVMNEAAKQKFEAYKNCLRGTADAGGVVLMASNDPTKVAFEWVSELIAEILGQMHKGEVLEVGYYKIDPELNPKIDQVANAGIDKIIRAIRPDQADEGLARYVDERAYSPPFVEAVHVVPMPTLGLPDITRDITQAVVGRAYDYIAGTDFQFTPHNVTIIFKIFGSVEAPILWAVDEIYTPKSTDDEHIDEIEGEGYRSGNVLVIGDCSGETQDGKHSGVTTSFQVYENRGWRIVSANKKVDPRGRAPKNPNVEKSIGRVHHALAADRGNGLRAMMVDPRCPRLITDLVKCKLRRTDGGIKTLGIHAHAGDAFRYPQWWLTTYADCYSAAAQGPSPYAPRARRGRR